jgi:hypothetical protein
MLALAEDKVLPRDHEVTCLVLEDSAEAQSRPASPKTSTASR